MDKEVKVAKVVYDSREFSRVVAREFTTFTQPIPEVDRDTPEELFRLYEKLYYIIDVEGITDSHEYLVRKSTELTGFVETTQEIQPLLDEIADLRQELLEANRRIDELETPVDL
jgi:hypothetical protein